MNHTFFKRLSIFLLSCLLLLGTGWVPAATASTEETDGFHVTFSDPYAKVGQPMTLAVSGASDPVTYSWTVDGICVGTDPSYTPAEEDLMKWIRVTATCGSDTATAEMFFSKLPVVYINTENDAQIVSKEDYINAELIIQGNEVYNSDTTTLYHGATEIRGRGNSTWTKPKKPYKLKLDKKADVFGMGKNKHWVLLANYLDESLMRNTLAYDLSGAMGMEQMSTVYVDVVLNGEFMGNYQFCEQVRVDNTRIDVFDWEGFAEDSAGIIADAEGLSKNESSDLENYMLENMGWITSGTVTFGDTTYTIADYSDIEIPSIDGGYLLELDEYYDEVSKFKTENKQPIMFKNPEFVRTNSDMMSFVKTYVQAFENAVRADSYTTSYAGKTVHYSDLFDFDSLVDYWLINEIFFNEELNKKSTYMYKDLGGLMIMGPIWDMDWSSGGEGKTYHTEQWSTVFYSTNAQANNWYKSLIKDPYFFTKAQERYWQIRNRQVADMLDALDTNYDLLKESAKANGEKWGYKSDYKKYVDDLRNWFHKHLTWLDAQMATQDTLAVSLDYDADANLSLSMTDKDGYILKADPAEHAPADGILPTEQPLKLTVSGDHAGNAALYINGRRLSVTPVSANISTTIEISGDALTAQTGEKNVLEIQIEKTDGTVLASRYITVRTEEVPACAHKNVTVVATVAPTCTENGYTEYKCECGASYRDAITPATGHTWGNWNLTKAPAIGENGQERRDCENCNTFETRTVDALKEEPKAENPFEDITEDMFCYDAVLWAVEQGITTGKTETTFQPSGNCTRAQVVTFLWRAAGKPAPGSAVNPFPDVPEGKYYTDAVLWAVENDITAGFKDGTFGPDKTCTRSQIVTFLWRYAHQPQPGSTENPFPDVKTSAYYGQAVLWAVEKGITTGFKDGIFGPNKTCTRDQIVTFLWRYTLP